MANEPNDPLGLSAVREMLKEAGLPLGPTGSHPSGKLNGHDEGGINIGIGAKAGKVIMDFGTPVSWLGFDPGHARALAASLTNYADAADGQK